MRRLAVFAVASLLGTLSSAALAASECPGPDSGDWFCDPAKAPAQPAPAPTVAPPPAATEPASLAPVPAEEASHVDESLPIEPRHRHRRRFREWGLNLHGTIGLMGGDDSKAKGAHMNGLGGALRFRPIPWVAVEGSLELIWGKDYNGYKRFEDALLVNALFFANPRSAVQLYGIAGFGLGNAFLDSGTKANGEPVSSDETYAYFGGQVGAGLEARVTRHLALGADLLGFLRSRKDRYADRNPEFVDASSGRSTNTSGGGLLRLGATYYW